MLAPPVPIRYNAHIQYIRKTPSSATNTLGGDHSTSGCDCDGASLSYFTAYAQ